MSSSLLTNSVVVYESQCGGMGWIAWSQPMSTAVHITWHGAQINFGDLSPYLTPMLFRNLCPSVKWPALDPEQDYWNNLPSTQGSPAGRGYLCLAVAICSGRGYLFLFAKNVKNYRLKYFFNHQKPQCLSSYLIIRLQVRELFLLV